MLNFEGLEDWRLLASGLQLFGIRANRGYWLKVGAVLNVAPRELTFRFNESQSLNTATLDAIQITRSGGNSQFEVASIRMASPCPVRAKVCRAIVLGLFLLLLRDLGPERWAGANDGSSADPKAKEIAREYVEQSVLSARRKVCQRLAQEEAEWLETANLNAAFISGEQLPGPLRQRLEMASAEGPRQLAAAFKEYAASQEQELTEAKNAWIEIRGTRNQMLLDRVNLLATSGAAMHIASLFSSHNRWFWLSSLIAVAVLIALIWHDNRHEFRRIRYGGWARGMGLFRLLEGAFWLLLAATMVTFLCGDRLYRKVVKLGSGATESPYEVLDREMEECRETPEQRQAYNEAQQRLEQTLGRWMGKTGKATGEMDQQWRAAHAQRRAALLASSVKQTVLKAIQDDAGKLEELGREYTKNKADVARFQQHQDWIRLTIGIGIIGVTIGGAVQFARRARRRRRDAERVCPMCWGANTLEPEPAGSYGALETVRCNRLMSGNPYGECDFSFLSSYRRMKKLFILSVGDPTSGKTLWLAMLYRELITGNYKEYVKFQKLKSKSFEHFDRLVDEIINSRVAHLGLQVGQMPHPLIFDFEDNDRYGKSNVLVSIFDYSGEVTQGMQLNDPFRQRALEADAYLFFCDPTQGKEKQEAALRNFADDVYALRRIHDAERRKGTRAGRANGATRSTHSRRVPVAICVSKIDLLFDKQDPCRMRSRFVEQFFEDLKEIDESHKPMSLKLMEARSELVTQFRDTIWPNWQIEKQIGYLSRGPFKFFPLTPVGLDDLGERDLRERTLEPYAIAEPLLWLLHMSGFSVLNAD